MRRRWIVAWLVVVALLATVAALASVRGTAPLPPVCWYCMATGEVRDAPDGGRLPGVTMRLFSPSRSSLQRGILESGRTLKTVTSDVFRGGHEMHGWIVEGTGDFVNAGGQSWERCTVTPTER